eukprot:3935689-Lingulodinium_polyedra.AAC.1
MPEDANTVAVTAAAARCMTSGTSAAQNTIDDAQCVYQLANSTARRTWANPTGSLAHGAESAAAEQ